MPAAYPLNLRTIIRASKRRSQAASFAVSNPMRGYGWAQATGRDTPVQWDVTFRFTTEEAQTFRTWFVTDLEQGINAFTLPIRTEFGLVAYTCRFLPQGLLPAREVGEVWEYTATIVARDQYVNPYRAFKAHTIAGSPDGALTDYQMRVVAYYGSGTDAGESVYLGTDVQTDFSDVRFYGEDGLTPLSYWRDQSTLVDGVSCVFWVKVPSIPASPDSATIRLYYAATGAPDASNIRATMLAGDDFRTMYLSQQINTGFSGMLSADITKLANGDLLIAMWSVVDQRQLIYRSTDNALTAPTLLSTLYAASTSRSHPTLDSNGATKVYACVKNTGATAVYLKTSTDSGATWSSESTIVSGLTAVFDPRILYVSSSQLLMFVRDTSGGDFRIRCYESTDDGASWAFKSTVYTVSTTGLNSLEDITAKVLPSGRLMVGWEKEVTEKGQSKIEYAYSDDGGATFSAVGTIIDYESTTDHEGGRFALSPAGVLQSVFGSNVNGGPSYEAQQLFTAFYDEGANTWSAAVMLSESYSTTENRCVYADDGVLVNVGTRQYEIASPVYSSFLITTTRLTGDDFSDRDLVQTDGLAYVLPGGAWIEGYTRGTPTRGFLTFDGFTGSDYVVEALMSAPSPLTQADTRVVYRYTDASNHYMASIESASALATLWKRVAGTYTALFNTAYTSAINTLYRVEVTVRAQNPTTLDMTSNGTAVHTGRTENPTTQTAGTIGVSGSATLARRATLCRHVFARKWTANPPTHGTWTVPEETAGGC